MNKTLNRLFRLASERIIYDYKTLNLKKPLNDDGTFECSDCGENKPAEELRGYTPARGKGEASFSEASANIKFYENLLKAYEKTIADLKQFKSELELLPREQVNNQVQVITIESDPELNDLKTKYYNSIRDFLVSILPSHRIPDDLMQDFQRATNNSKNRGGAMLEIDKSIASLGQKADDAKEILSGKIEEKHQQRISWMLPTCKDCAEEWEACAICKEEGPNEIMDFQNMRTSEGVVNICEHCYERDVFSTCDSCEKLIDGESSYPGPSYEGNYCLDCYSEKFHSCCICESVKEVDDLTYVRGDPFCDSCLADAPGYDADKVMSVLNTEEMGALPSIAKLPPPLDEKATNVLLQILKSLKNRPYSKESLYQVILKYPQVKETIRTQIVAYIETCMEAFNFTNWAEVESKISEMQNMTDYMRSIYPGVNGLFATPTVINAQEELGKETPSFTLTMQVAPQVMSLAKKMFGEATAEMAHDILVSGGHHEGAIAYARVGYDEENNAFVVNNLQTDADIQSAKRKLERRVPADKQAETLAAIKWLLNTYKFWPIYLLDAVKRFGKAMEQKVYLTGFELQQKKWRNSIPEREKDVYERIPEAMGMPEEYTDDIKLNIEGVRINPNEVPYSLRRIARFKKLQKFCN